MIRQHNHKTGFQNKKFGHIHNKLCVLLLHFGLHLSIHCCLNFKPWNPKSVMEDQKEKISVSENLEMNIDVQPELFVDKHEPETGGDTTGILRRWKRKEMLRRGSLGLRGIALFMSLISLILTASNKHGYWNNFDKFEEYRYKLKLLLFSIRL